MGSLWTYSMLGLGALLLVAGISSIALRRRIAENLRASGLTSNPRWFAFGIAATQLGFGACLLLVSGAFTGGIVRALDTSLLLGGYLPLAIALSLAVSGTLLAIGVPWLRSSLKSDGVLRVTGHGLDHRRRSRSLVAAVSLVSTGAVCAVLAVVFVLSAIFSGAGGVPR